jgi:hypothetical protein
LSQVEKGATKSTYKLGVDFKRCEDKGEKSALKFILSSTYHKEEATIKPTKAHYPSNPQIERGSLCLHVLWPCGSLG